MKNYVKSILKKVQNVLVFIDLLTDIMTSVISPIQITCDGMCVQHVIQ